VADEKQTATAPKQKHGLFEFVIGGLACVGLPALMTAMAPVSWIELNRIDDRVAAKTQTCVFFVFPYSTQELDDVKKVSTTFRRGELLHHRAGDNKRGRAESEGGVVLHGPNDANGNEKLISVAVSPASFKTVEEKINGFLQDAQQKTMKQFVVANWKVGIIFAIPVCLLTVLFVIGWSIWLGQMLAKPFGFAPPEVTHNASGDSSPSD
jgi:hypothetical protein